MAAGGLRSAAQQAPRNVRTRKTMYGASLRDASGLSYVSPSSMALPMTAPKLKMTQTSAKAFLFAGGEEI